MDQKRQTPDGSVLNTADFPWRRCVGRVGGFGVVALGLVQINGALGPIALSLILTGVADLLYEYEDVLVPNRRTKEIRQGKP